MRCDGNVCVIIEDQVDDDADDNGDDTFDGHPASVGDREDHRDHSPLDSGGGKSPPSGGNDHPLSDDHHESLSDGSDVEDHGNQDDDEEEEEEEDDHQHDTEDVDKQHAPMLQVSNTHLDRYVQDTLDAISHASNEEDEEDEDDKEEEKDDDDEIDKNKRDDGSDPTPQDHGPALGRMRAAYADDPWSMPDDARFFVSHGDESEGDHGDDSDHDDGDDDGIEENDHDEERDQHAGREWYNHETPSLFIVLGAPANGLCAPLDHRLGRAHITPLDEDEDDAEDRGDDFLDGDSDSDDDEPERFPRSIIVGHISDEPAWSLPTDADAGDIDPTPTQEEDARAVADIEPSDATTEKDAALAPDDDDDDDDDDDHHLDDTAKDAIISTIREDAAQQEDVAQKRSRKRRTTRRTTPPPAPGWTTQTSTRTTPLSTARKTLSSIRERTRMTTMPTRTPCHRRSPKTAL
ncbi:hypothetical protein TW95_gp1248 [Pandoravirus inopinatum]|uniref:Uncharacterized protein n=1 Tax=Pandoravirus inopinatum TaxID=1605721 RepID=A0A0B5JDZ3_9VIRU|nr:hypothetical protein TW95_gp1248 [Pandoravirus inopinatum]AJF97982.1 hypothetical protein [Pandoravirus inopinatum]